MGTCVSTPGGPRPAQVTGPTCSTVHFVREPLTLRGGCILGPPLTPTLHSQLARTSRISGIDCEVTFGKLKSFFALELYTNMRGFF